jgi:hypothetical protein
MSQEEIETLDESLKKLGITDPFQLTFMPESKWTENGLNFI